MLSCLMKLQAYSLLMNWWKFILQRFQLCVGLNTLYPYFSIKFPKSQLWIRWLRLIRQYTTYLFLAYITNLIIYSNYHNTNFIIGDWFIQCQWYQGGWLFHWSAHIFEYDKITSHHSFFSWIRHYATELKTLQSSIIHSGWENLGEDICDLENIFSLSSSSSSCGY